MLAASAAALLAGCALPWRQAPPAGGTTLTSTLSSIAAYDRVAAGAQACYPGPTYQLVLDYFKPDTKTGAMKLYEIQTNRKLEIVSFTIAPTPGGSTINLHYRHMMSGFPSAAAAWLNGEPNRCPAR
jgi:hypothetical protein